MRHTPSLAVIDSVISYVSPFKPLTDLEPMVFQRRETDCWIACLAMLTGEDYEYVELTCAHDMSEDDMYGVTLHRMVAMLRRMGYSPRFYYPHMFSPDKVGSYTLERARGLTAIHLLPSLNGAEDNCAHYVYVSGGVVYDPTLLHGYGSYEELEPLGVIYLA